MNTPTTLFRIIGSVFIFLYLSFIYMTVKAQGPITPTDDFIGSKEIMLLWDTLDNEYNLTLTMMQEFSVKPDFEGITNIEERISPGAFGTAPGYTTGSRYLSISEGDFNGNGIQNAVVVHQQNNTLFLRVLNHADLANPESGKFYRSDGPVYPSDSDNDRGRIIVRAADVDGDGVDEIVLAYIETNQNMLQIEIFEYTNNKPVVSYKDEVVSLMSNFETLSLTTDDLDMDGQHEIAVVFRSAADHDLYAKIYKAGATNELVDKLTPKSKVLIDNTLVNNISVTAAITSGFLNNDNKKDLAVAWGSFSNCSGCPDTWVIPIQLQDNPATAEISVLETMVVNPEDKVHFSLSGNYLNNLNLVNADLNLDGKTEVILGANPCRILSIPEDSTKFDIVNTFGGYNDEYGFAVDFMRAGDVTGNYKDEIVLVNNFFGVDDNMQQYLELEVFSFNENLKAERIIHVPTIRKIPSGGNYKDRRHYGIAMGDFNGDNFKIGPGKKYTVSDIVQPIVILNAPPTHFDVIEDTEYDFALCYTGDVKIPCNFWAEYTESNTNDQSLSTTIHSDWGVSAEISGGGSYLGVGVSAYMKGTYGEKFSNTSTSQKIVNVTSTVTAKGDDRIYATITDYELWEYPIYMKNSDKKGTLMAVVPVSTEDTWFSSKERTAYDYVPTHESGNILSYSRWNDSLDMRGEPIADLSTYEVSTQDDNTFSFNTSEIFSQEEVNEFDIGMEVGGSVGGWGIEVSGSAYYNFGQIQTHSVSIQKDVSITGNIGSYNGGLGEAGYSVKPYLYRANNGALVVDYKVEPILPVGSGDTDTWWSQHYGQNPDPAFVLPWRLDPEKELALQSEDKRTLTKSITLSKKKLTPGDTITLTANIHNFSVKYCADSVSVQFFLGKPENNVAIADINGNNAFYVRGGIVEQSYKPVSFRWVVPEYIGGYNRLYGVIDKENALEEVHEVNNTGWIILSGDGGISTSISDESTFRKNVQEKAHIWPNPAQDKLNIAIPENTNSANVAIITASGAFVKHSAIEHIGYNGEETTINISDLEPGVYFVRVRTDNILQTARLIKL